MLPLAPGANGHPPSPPIEASSAATPAFTAVTAFASPAPRVLWKCMPMRMPVASDTRRCRSRTRPGVVVPIVSARVSMSAPQSVPRRAACTTASGGVRPWNGQSHAVASTSSTAPAAWWASSTIAGSSASDSCVVRPVLARLCSSDIETTYSMRGIPAAMDRRAPLRLATRAENSTDGHRCSAAATCSASASAGTARGETKLVTSMRRTPVAASASSRRSLPASGTGASICSPSRRPTSRMSTDGPGVMPVPGRARAGGGPRSVRRSGPPGP
jgi:hypothetical protein